jgi:hypothetical protein
MALLGSYPLRMASVSISTRASFAIFGVEVCRAMVSKVHSNHNPKESGYLRHFFS